MSNSSLYGSTGNVTVSANNLTTLYNATTGNVVTQNVPDRDFTTLYTKQADIQPTRSYGNSNVEAFLNAGTDGGNTVQNIIMTGNLTVGGVSDLGPIGNVVITGGDLNYIISTDGTGNLQWVPQQGADGNSTPYIHFAVSATANNQQFTSDDLENYAANTEFNLFKNGVNIEPTYYTKTSANTVQVNILLNTGDTIDILASGGGGGGMVGGSTGQVQYNGGNIFSGNSSFTFDQINSLLTVGNIETSSLAVTGETDLGSVANVTITGGTNTYVLSTDGAGNLSWAAPSGGAATGVNATIANVHITGGSNGQSIITDGTGNLSFATVVTSPAGSNTQLQYNNAGSFGGSANLTFDNISNTLSVTNIVANGSQLTQLTGANVTGTVPLATLADSVSNSSQPNITSTGTLIGLSSGGTVNFTTASNVSLGSDSNVHITGGTTGQLLSTDGAGNLSWINISGGSIIQNGTSNVSIPVSDGNIYISVNGLANLMSVSSTGVTIATTTTIQQGIEKVTANATGSTGTVNFDLLTQAILNKTANSASSFNINARGNSTTTLDTVMSTSQSMTMTYINKKNTGSPGVMSSFQIDGTTQTVYWASGVNPTTNSSTYDLYTFNILKTAANTYTVFGNFGSYN